MSFLTLDVGCGHKPHGDVNIDLYTSETHHRFDDFRGYSGLNHDRICNFIHADAHDLPLRDSLFRRVYSRALLEHVDNPIRVLKEMLRVSSFIVEIHVPHRYSRKAKAEGHQNFLNATWFLKVTERLGYYCQVETSKWEALPHLLMPILRLPREIHVLIFKGKVDA